MKYNPTHIMKKYLLLLFLVFSLFVKAQDKITFDYDDAGNQIKRELCLSCTKANYKTKAPKEIIALKEEDLEKFTPEDAISYYPNPVKEELYLKWELVADKNVTAIQLYDLNGRVLQTYDNLAKTNNLNIPFLNYPKGTYLVVLVYNGGEQKTIKIVK
jgi:Secretion system C-terminal sorting domain